MTDRLTYWATQKGDVDAAAAAYARVLAADQQHPDAKHYMSLILFDRGTSRLSRFHVASSWSRVVRVHTHLFREACGRSDWFVQELSVGGAASRVRAQHLSKWLFPATKSCLHTDFALGTPVWSTTSETWREWLLLR